MISRRITAGSIFLLILLVSCNATSGPRFDKRELVLEGAGSRQTIQAEIARTDEQRSHGLMYRKTLDDGKGMLFIFERDEMVSFWMKNTLIPLSIAFISSDGRIMEIRDMQPESLESVQSGRSVRYALEVPQGWFGRVHLGVGDRLLVNGL